MKKVKKFDDLQSGICYTDFLGNDYYFFGIDNNNKTAVFLRKIEDEDWKCNDYEVICLDKDDIKALRYSL